MKTFFVLLLALTFLLSGVLNVLKQMRITIALEEIVGFINLVKTEVHYKIADFENIILRGKTQNYKYIAFSDSGISLDKSVGGNLGDDFDSFINKIGTTDEAGQISICEEYKGRFEEKLMKRKVKEKEKLQVNTALSLFGALSVIIFFL